MSDFTIVAGFEDKLKDAIEIDASDRFWIVQMFTKLLV